MSISSFTESLIVISWKCKSLCGYWTNMGREPHWTPIWIFFEALSRLLQCLFYQIHFTGMCNMILSQQKKNTFQDAVNSNWCNWLERKHLLAPVQKWPYGEQAELLCPPLLVACTPTTIMSTKTCALIPLRIMFSTKNWAHNTFRTNCHFLDANPFYHSCCHFPNMQYIEHIFSLNWFSSNR